MDWIIWLIQALFIFGAWEKITKFSKLMEVAENDLQFGTYGIIRHIYVAALWVMIIVILSQA